MNVFWKNLTRKNQFRLFILFSILNLFTQKSNALDNNEPNKVPFNELDTKLLHKIHQLAQLNKNQVRNILLNNKLKRSTTTTKTLDNIEEYLDDSDVLFNNKVDKLFGNYLKPSDDQLNDESFLSRIMYKRGKTYIRLVNKKDGYYNRPCLVNVISCYFFGL